MRVLVCGGRDFDDLPLLGDALERVHARHVITLLIHGGAQGADIAAHHWAGFKRVLAFPGGRGTANMVKQARSAGVSVCEVSRTADW
jgi:SLOG family YspA-like protein